MRERQKELERSSKRVNERMGEEKKSRRNEEEK